jgi:hypothetical protein
MPELSLQASRFDLSNLITLVFGIGIRLVLLLRVAASRNSSDLMRAFLDSELMDRGI